MNIKRKIIPLSMAVVMAGSMAFPVWAETGPGAVVTGDRTRLLDNTLEYDELADLVHEYNVTVINNRVAYQKAEADSYKDYSDVYWEAANKAVEAADAAREASEAVMGSAGLQMLAMQAEAAAQRAVSAAEDNTNSMETTRLSYEKAEKSIVMQAQATMNNYQQMQLQMEPLKKNRELLEAVYQSAQARQSIGMATYADVLEAQQNIQALDAQITKLENQINAIKQNLCIMTGWSADGQPEIMPIPESDMGRIEAMNVDEDIEKALEQDYTLRIDYVKLSNAGSLESSQIVEQTIANDKEQVAAAVNNAYQNTLQAKAAYDQSVLDYEIAARSMNAANTKYQLGTISRLEYLKDEASFVAAQVNKEVTNLALFQTMEVYDWTVKGVR